METKSIKLDQSSDTEKSLELNNILEYFKLIARSPIPTNILTRLFSNDQLDLLGEQINSRGLVYATDRTLRRLIRHQHFNDLNYLLPRLDIKQIANNTPDTADLAQYIGNIRTQSRHTKISIRKQCDFLLQTNDTIAYSYEQKRAEQCETMEDKLSLFLSNLHTQHHKINTDSSKSRCIIS